MNNPRFKLNPCRNPGMGVPEGDSVEVSLGSGVSLGGGVTRAFPISESSVPKRSRPMVGLGVNGLSVGVIKPGSVGVGPPGVMEGPPGLGLMDGVGVGISGGGT